MDTSLLADAIDKAVEKIVSEELIAAEWKSFSFGFLNPELFHKYLENGKVHISASWRGTYNHSYNGEWNSYIKINFSLCFRRIPDYRIKKPVTEMSPVRTLFQPL